MFYLDFPKVVKASDEDSGNASKVEVFVDWSDKLNSPKKQEDSLDHAYTKLKFNRNLMSMVGRSPVKPGEIHIKPVAHESNLLSSKYIALMCG